jgi:hypothetical protein
MHLGGEQLTLGTPALVRADQAAKDIPWLFSFALRRVVHTGGWGGWAASGGLGS